MMDQGLYWGYSPNPDKLLFILDKPEEKKAMRWEFEHTGLNLNYVDVSQYLGAYLGPREELDASVRSKVEAWAHGLRTLAKIAKRYPQLAYAGLGMLLNLKWQCLKRNVPGLGSLMVPICALREALFPALFGGEEVSADLIEIIGHSVKRRGLDIPDPGLSEEHAYNTSKASNEVLLGSLLGGNDLKYVAHKVAYIVQALTDGNSRSIWRRSC